MTDTATTDTATTGADTTATAIVDAEPGGSALAPAPGLRLLGAAGAVCVDGTCSFEPTVGADLQ